MSNILRELMARTPKMAIQGDFIDERGMADWMEEQAGVPQEPTAMNQLRKKAEGESSQIQLDR